MGAQTKHTEKPMVEEPMAGQAAKAVQGGQILQQRPVGMMSNRALARTVRECDCAHGLETPWGYIVRSGARPRSSSVFSQWISGLTGFSLVVAASSLWIMPGSSFGEDIVGFKYGLSIVLAGLGVLLLWFGSQGHCYEVQVDIVRGELREAVRNRKGQARVLSRVPFSRIGSVFIDRTSGLPDHNKVLLLRYRDTAQIIEVARAPEEALIMLRDRLARDILGMSALRKRQKDALRRQSLESQAAGKLEAVV